MPNYVRRKTSRCGKITELFSFFSARTSCYFSFFRYFPLFPSPFFFSSSDQILLQILFPILSSLQATYFCSPDIFLLQIFVSLFLVLLLYKSYFSPPNTFSPLFLLCFSCPPNIFYFQIFPSFSFSSANQIFSNLPVVKFGQNPQFSYVLFEELSWYSCLFLRAK